MPDELIDITDEKGNLIGVQNMKSQAHKEGLWHLASHLCILNSKGEILLQKRAKTKELCPGLWDLAVSGHILAGETPDDGMKREAIEEIGLKIKIDSMKKIGVYNKSSPIDGWEFPHNEIVHVYFYKYEGSIQDLTMQVEEVDELRFIPLTTFERDIQDKVKSKNYVHPKFLLEIIKEIKKCA